MTGAPTGPLEVDIRLALDRFELDVSFETSHTFTGIFGESGSGKTSLLETLAGLRRNARGRIRQGDHVWLDSNEEVFVRPEHRRIGYVPQDGLLFPDRTVHANLLAGRKRSLARGLPFGRVFEAVTKLLELEPLLERQVPTLSGGERQRVALGRAICSGPSLLMLDEPLASLDLPLRRRLLPFLRRLNAEFEIPSILVSHDPIEVQALCDDLIVLCEGKQVARGKPSDVLTDPAVYSLAEQRGFDNVIQCEFGASSEGTSRVRLPGSDPPIEIVTGAGSGLPGENVLLGLPAHEIMIATRRPEGVSARNVLLASIVKLRSIGPVGLVTVSLGENTPELTAEVTEAAMESLGLLVGGRVYVVFKATSCKLYGDKDNVGGRAHGPRILPT